MAEFCRIHAFYDCPVCRGEEVVWVIPIVDGADPMGHGGNVVGTIEIPETFDDQLAFYDVGWEGVGEALPPIPLAVEYVPAIEDPEVEVPDPDLLERVKSLFSILNEPYYREAAAKGRKVHEDALTLMDESDLSYPDAIQEILRSRDDA